MIVIVGAGQAAAQLVLSLRQGGYNEPIPHADYLGLRLAVTAAALYLSHGLRVSSSVQCEAVRMRMP